jgi:hypothetical protein
MNNDPEIWFVSSSVFKESNKQKSELLKFLVRRFVGRARSGEAGGWERNQAGAGR